ncbi:hypothetical protein QJQ45_002421 [Haematococcus lacustris]|nr:hypothetical protein QJQ45_002421 [Haematococcus lacustris]
MAPKAAEKAPAKKAAPAKTGDKNKLALAGDKKNNKKVAKVESYKLYIYKVLKQRRTFSPPSIPPRLRTE